MFLPRKKYSFLYNPKRLVFVTQVENRVTKTNFWVTKTNICDFGYKNELLGYKNELFFIFYTKSAFFQKKIIFLIFFLFMNKYELLGYKKKNLFLVGYKTKFYHPYFPPTQVSRPKLTVRENSLKSFPAKASIFITYQFQT